MDNDFDAVTHCYSDFEQPSGLVAPNEDDQVIVSKDSDRVVVGVQHTLVRDPMLSGAFQDYGIHVLKLS